MSTKSGANVTGQKKAIQRTLVTMFATYKALTFFDDKFVSKLAGEKLLAVRDILGENLETSSEKASMLRAVGIMWHGLWAIARNDDVFLAAVVAQELYVAGHLLRECKTRDDRPDVDLVAQIKAIANSLDSPAKA